MISLNRSQKPIHVKKELSVWHDSSLHVTFRSNGTVHGPRMTAVGGHRKKQKEPGETDHMMASVGGPLQ